MPLVIVESGNDGNHRSPRLQLHGRPESENDQRDDA